FHWWILEQPQVIQRGPRQSAPPLGIHRRRRAHPFLRRAGFDLDKNQAIRLTKDKVDFSPGRTEVRSKKLEPLSLKLLFRRTLSQLTVLQVQRLLRLAPPRLDASE